MSQTIAKFDRSSRPLGPHGAALLWAMLLVGALVSSGCAITDYTVDSPYEPAKKPVAQAPPAKLSLRVHSAHRGAQDVKVGVKKNGYRMEMADILLGPSVEEWIGRGLTQELERAGFQVGSTQAGSGSPFVMDIEVEQFFVEPDMGFWAIELAAVTILTVRVTPPRSSEGYQRRFVGVSTDKMQVTLDGDFEDHLQSSTRDAFEQVVRATVELCNEYGYGGAQARLGLPPHR